MRSQHMSAKTRRTFGCVGLAFGSMFVLVGLIIIVTTAKQGFLQNSTDGWPKTEGLVTAVDTQSKRSTGQSPLQYRYRVDDVLYRSDRVVFVHAESLDFSDWLSLANDFEEEDVVDVFYNPADPAQSVLIPGSHELAWGNITFGLIFAGFALIWMIAWWGMAVWLPNKLQGLSKVYDPEE